MLGLVARLAREGQLDLDVVRGHEPAGGDLGGLDLVLERDLQKIQDIQVARDLGLERGLGLEPPQHGLVPLVEIA